LFSADSRAVVDLLATAPGVDRMTLTVASIDDLLSSLGLEDSARLRWLKGMVASRKEVSDYRKCSGDPPFHRTQSISAPEHFRSSLRPSGE
jgi:hypothetical protein